VRERTGGRGGVATITKKWKMRRKCGRRFDGHIPVADKEDRGLPEKGIERKKRLGGEVDRSGSMYDRLAGISGKLMEFPKGDFGL